MKPCSGFLISAKHLAETAPQVSKDEQDFFYRSAISRAYYSAFHHALEFAKSKLSFQPPRNRSVHGELIKSIRTYNARISDYLYDLKSIRNQCDYYERVGSIDLAWTTNKRKAEFIIENLKL